MGDKRPSTTPIVFSRVTSIPQPNAISPNNLPVATASPILAPSPRLSPAGTRARGNSGSGAPIPPKSSRASSIVPFAAAGIPNSPSGAIPATYEPAFALTPGVAQPSYSEAKRMLEASDRLSGLAVEGRPSASTSPPGGPTTYSIDTSCDSVDGEVDGYVSGPSVEGQPAVDTIGRITNALGRVGPLVQLEQQTGIGRLYLAVVIAIVACLLFVAIFGVSFFSSVIAFVYPAYMSFKSLERNRPDEHMHWLVYWVVYGVFHLIEPVIDAGLESWVPFYRLSKLIFLVWCFMPQTRGCTWLYAHSIRPILHANETSIDAFLVKLNYNLGQIARELREMGAELASAVLGQVFGAMTSIRLPDNRAADRRDERKLL